MPRTVLSLVVCACLVLTRALGAHAHVAHDEHDLALNHDHGASAIAFQFDAGHSHSHSDHGEVDATADDMNGKVWTGIAVAVIAAVVLLVLQSASAALTPVPAWRGPPFRRRIPLLPPSQAPPLVR